MTPGARRVLEELAADPACDLVQAGRDVWCGTRQTTVRVVRELLWCMAVSVTWRDDDSATYYGINDTGRALLRRPELEAEIAAAIGHGPFSVIDDKVVHLTE